MKLGWLLAGFLTCLLALGLAPARAEEISDLEAAVEAGSSLTYDKLVRNVFKGAREGQSAGEMISAAEKVLRRPGSKERTIIPADTRLHSFEAIKVRGDARQYLVLFWTAETDATDVVGGDACILAVFPADSAEAQDVVEVKSDKLCYLSQGKLPALGPDDAFAVLNHHLNAGQSYLDTVLFHIHQGRFRVITSVFTLTGRGGCRDNFNEDLSWQSAPQPGSPYHAVTATVTLTQGPDDAERADCPPKQRARTTRVFSDTCRWEAAKDRYVCTPQGREALARFNKDKF